MTNPELTFRELFPDSLQGWQEHEEQMERFSDFREVELEAGSEELLCACRQTDADSFDGRACPVHAKDDAAEKDALLEIAYYNTPVVPVPHKKPVQTQFRFRRKSA